MTIVEDRAALGRPPTHSSKGFTFDLAVVGLGYVGLPTALTFHAAGHAVLGIDVNPARLAAIKGQDVDLTDGDRHRLGTALADGRLTLTDRTSLLSEAACVVICVPTPVDAHLVPDLSILRGACATVVQTAVAGQVIILTSTTYVGSTHDLLTVPLRERGLIAGRDLWVAFSPERINPGIESAHEDVPRVVGGTTLECTHQASRHLSHTVRRVHQVSSPEVAELTKLLENTFRAVNIALINEFADIGHHLGLDILEVIDAAATKPFGFMKFTPGPGVGGHCIPCDPHYLTWQLQRSRAQVPLIQQAMDEIVSRPHVVADRAREVLAQHAVPITGARIVVVGVAYKPNVADVRESPALDIMVELHRMGADLFFHDSFVDCATFGPVTKTSVPPPADNDYDLVIVHTLHRDFDPATLPLNTPIVDASFRLPLRPGITRI